MQKFILDTNILLNGVFNPLSLSTKVICLIVNCDIEGYVLDRTLSEAKNILNRVEKNTGISLHKQFQAVLASIPPITVDPVSESDISRYRVIGGVEDAAIAAAAMRDGLTVCTHDDDFYHAKEMGVSVHDPSETLLAARGYSLSLDQVFPAFLVTPYEGAFYIEASTCWGDLTRSARLTGLWPILDAEGIGRILLDLDQNAILLILDCGVHHSVELPDYPPGDHVLKLVVSYDSNSGIGLYMGHRMPRAKIAAGWNTEHTSTTTGRITFFQGRNGSFGAPVKIKRIAGFAKSLTESAANKLLSGKQPIIPQERLPLEEVVLMYYQ